MFLNNIYQASSIVLQAIRVSSSRWRGDLGRAVARLLAVRGGQRGGNKKYF